MRTLPQQLLARAIEAARRALRDLDSDQIPADLHRVAAHSGTLPPPLAGALLKALDRYDWLRERALGAWEDADPEAEGPDGLAAAYLARPPGWVSRLLAAYGDLVAAEAAQDAAGAAADAGDARRELEVARRRLREAKAESRRQIRDLEQALEQERKVRRSLQAGAARDDGEARATLDGLGSELAAREADVAALRHGASILREELRRARRDRADAEAAAAELAALGGLSVAGPEELALHLDQIAAGSRPPPIPAGPGAAKPAAVFELPPRVRPDAAGAIEWLVGDAPPVTALVDGYNAGFVLGGTGDPAAARARLELELRRLVTLASGRLAAVVVYDSAIDAAEPPARRGGIEVVFTDGRSADDVLVDLAATLAGRRVVISNDRAVRERSEEVGAVAVWSDALRAWSMRS